MSDKRKTEKEIINFSVYRGKQTSANEMKRKRRNLGTESCLTASDESPNWGGITVYSIKFTKNGFIKNQVLKFVLFQHLITEVKRPFFIFK